ncbi:MAG: RNA-binding transcriptional accessory protein [Anaerolineaceae bacterium]|nr:RNA-binding transcriptional accessory protein [Anaerolineaceae bacterium]
MAYEERIASALKLKVSQVAATIELLSEGNTIPFIARYRKERTGKLDEEQLRQVEALVKRFTNMDERRASIVASIESQGKMTDEIMKRLVEADTLTALEDIYQPYKRKRKTRASVARSRGLQELADRILAQQIIKGTAEDAAQEYLTDDVPDVEAALAGARDIVAEMATDHSDVRRITREKALKFGSLLAEKKSGAKDERGVYRTYYEFRQRIERIQPHQVLAINRGEKEKVLRVKMEVPDRDWRNAMEKYFSATPLSPFDDQLMLALEDGANRLLLPAIERDIRRGLTKTAEKHAINVFATNLRSLLTQPPLSGHTVMGIDPGYRTGCKIAIVDSTGKILDTGTIYPHFNEKKWNATLELLEKLVKKHLVDLISIGNGTASRETEKLAAELIQRVGGNLNYIITNEAGASVYSASPEARREMPNLDVSIRGAVSIARRVQDPLAELVKIEPKAIGVGMYQHDVNQTELGSALDAVVGSAVNQVGVDVNTASPALLTYVSGLGPKLAERIVAFRDEEGPFKSRKALKNVSGLGNKAFEQAAGFLRIRGGDNPLDMSAIHPESYPVAETILLKSNLNLQSSVEQRREVLENFKIENPVEVLAKELNVGVPTLDDIYEQLVRPGRDPREDLPAPILRNDILSMDDLMVGMRLKGTVRNVIDFGAFIDIGVKQDGLMHISKIPRGHRLQIGNILEVEIDSIDIDRGRISLSWVEAE